MAEGWSSEDLHAVALMLAGADEDREDIQAETEKQEDTFDHIGSALGDLKHMSNVSISYYRPPLLSDAVHHSSKVLHQGRV